MDRYEFMADQIQKQAFLGKLFSGVAGKAPFVQKGNFGKMVREAGWRASDVGRRALSGFYRGVHDTLFSPAFIRDAMGPAAGRAGRLGYAAAPVGVGATLASALPERDKKPKPPAEQRYGPPARKEVGPSDTSNPTRIPQERRITGLPPGAIHLPYSYNPSAGGAPSPYGLLGLFEASRISQDPGMKDMFKTMGPAFYEAQQRNQKAANFSLDSMLQWAKQNPELAGALGGAAVGGLSGAFSDKPGAFGRRMLYGALGGSSIGHLTRPGALNRLADKGQELSDFVQKNPLASGLAAGVIGTGIGGLYDKPWLGLPAGLAVGLGGYGARRLNEDGSHQFSFTR